MNREIKFRAWDKIQKRTVPDNELQIQSLPDFRAAPLNESLTILGLVYTLMQFTGLKDKNGKEIYEGDILRIHDAECDDGMGENYKYTAVEFKNGAFKVEYDFGDYDMTAIGWAIDIWDDLDITCEVIGNIYENPEILNNDMMNKYGHEAKEFEL